MTVPNGNNCSTANDAAILFAIGFSSREASTLSRFSLDLRVLSRSFSLVASRGARVCYRDSWQHHGPAFAAWPAIVFLVSLQFTARSILPRSSTATATSASFAASYFTGAQHGVARYLGNFAERGCSLCQHPVPRRLRNRRCCASFSLLLSLIIALSLSPLSFRTLSSHSSFFFSSPQQGSRVRANVCTRECSRVSAFIIVALPVVLSQLSLLSLRNPIRLRPRVALCTASFIRIIAFVP